MHLVDAITHHYGRVLTLAESIPSRYLGGLDPQLWTRCDTVELWAPSQAEGAVYTELKFIGSSGKLLGSYRIEGYRVPGRPARRRAGGSRWLAGSVRPRAVAGATDAANDRLIALLHELHQACETVLFAVTCDADNNGGKVDRAALVQLLAPLVRRGAGHSGPH